MIKVVRIKKIHKRKYFKIYCLFSNEEYRMIDFGKLFKQWNIQKNDIEYPLLDIKEFKKVRLNNGTLCWDNIILTLPDENDNEQNYPYDLDPTVLYQNSKSYA